MSIALIISVVAIVILVLMVAGMYNGLVKLRNLFKNQDSSAIGLGGAWAN